MNGWRRLWFVGSVLSAPIAVLAWFWLVTRSGGSGAWLLQQEDYARRAATERYYERVAGEASKASNPTTFERVQAELLQQGGDEQYQRDLQAINAEYQPKLAAVNNRMLWVYGLRVTLAWVLLVGGSYAAGATTRRARRRGRRGRLDG